MKLSGRFVFVFQWIAPLVLVMWVLFGRALFGAPVGWLALMGLFISPFVLVAMYIPPVLVMFDREARMTRLTRRGYEIATYVLWGVMFAMGFVIVDGGDSGEVGSLLTVWFRLASGDTEGLLPIGMGLGTLALIAQLVMAILGIAASRKTAPTVTR